jgi:uncharacterized protein (DUF1778 family)
MLEAACDHARSVLLDPVFFKLDAARFRQFMRQLDAPSAPSGGMKRLMAIEPPWQTDAPAKKGKR